MGDQPMTKNTATKALSTQMATLTVKVDNINNNNKNLNRRCGSIRVPRGRDNRIIEE